MTLNKKRMATIVVIVAIAIVVLPFYNSMCSLIYCQKAHNRSYDIIMELLYLLPWNVNTPNDFGILTLFSHGKLPLVEACSQKDLVGVEKLVNKGANPNQTYSTTSQNSVSAVITGHYSESQVKILYLLFDNGADISGLTGYDSPLAKIYFSNDPYYQDVDMGMLKCLIENNANIMDSNVIFNAAEGNNVDALRYLVEQCGIDINSPIYGSPPLIGAVNASSYEAAQYLMNVGADKSLVDHDGRTANGCARVQGDNKMIAILNS